MNHTAYISVTFLFTSNTHFWDCQLQTFWHLCILWSIPDKSKHDSCAGMRPKSMLKLVYYDLSQDPIQTFPDRPLKGGTPIPPLFCFLLCEEVPILGFSFKEREVLLSIVPMVTPGTPFAWSLGKTLIKSSSSYAGYCSSDIRDVTCSSMQSTTAAINPFTAIRPIWLNQENF